MGTFKYRLSASPGPLCVEDYRALAKRALPRVIWAYVDNGAEDQVTLDANRQAFARYSLKARVLTAGKPQGLGVDIAGRQLSLPVLLSPAGLVGLSHWTGELGAARAAEHAGTISTLSTAGSYSIEEVARGTKNDHFFQLYPWSDAGSERHDLTSALVRRAKDAGFAALFVTVDVQLPGNREEERRRGMGAPPLLTPAMVANAALRPSWCSGFLRHRRFTPKTLNELVAGTSALRGLELQARSMGADLNWQDFAWVRDHWDGPLFIKGLLDADDADRAVGLGADGVVVSNHGGRQLDGAVAALDALPAISERVRGRAQIVLEGGIRRGTDIVKALCLGADAVSIGRPFLYGLAAAGPRGAAHVIEILREEMLRAMTLMGVSRLDELGPSWLLPADSPVGF